MVTNSTLSDESTHKSTAVCRIAIFKEDCKHLFGECFIILSERQMCSEHSSSKQEQKEKHTVFLSHTHANTFFFLHLHVDMACLSKKKRLFLAFSSNQIFFFFLETSHKESCFSFIGLWD